MSFLSHEAKNKWVTEKKISYDLKKNRIPNNQMAKHMFHNGICLHIVDFSFSFVNTFDIIKT